jgi:hypothetical protein
MATSNVEEEDVLPAGFRRVTCGEYYLGKATHAVCRHGILVDGDADSHVCRWTPLIRLDDVAGKVDAPDSHETIPS